MIHASVNQQKKRGLTRIEGVKNMSQKNIQCPRCENLAHRIERTMINRFTSLFRPVMRYRCSFCDWENTIASGVAKQPKKK